MEVLQELRKRAALIRQAEAVRQMGPHVLAGLPELLERAADKIEAGEGTATYERPCDQD